MSGRTRIVTGVTLGAAAGLAGGLPSGSLLAALLMASGLGLLGLVIAVAIGSTTEFAPHPLIRQSFQPT